MKLALPPLLASILLMLAVSGFAEDKFDMEAARKLFEGKCSACHPLDRPLRKRKDPDGWRKTVERMKSYSAGRISDGEATVIAEYLSRARGAKP